MTAPTELQGIIREVLAYAPPEALEWELTVKVGDFLEAQLTAMTAERDLLRSDARFLARRASDQHSKPCSARRLQEFRDAEAAGKLSSVAYSCSCGLDELLDKHFKSVPDDAERERMRLDRSSTRG